MPLYPTLKGAHWVTHFVNRKGRHKFPSCPYKKWSSWNEFGWLCAFPKHLHPARSIHAMTLIREHGGSGKSLPCETSRVLTVYDELHRLDFSDANITFLNPKLFDSSDRSLTEKKAFYKQLGG